MSVWDQCAYQSALSFENFPYQLMQTKNVKKLVPAVDFGHNVGGLFDQEQKIYVTLTEYSPRSTEQFSQTRKSGTRQGKRQEHGWEGQTWDIGPKSRILHFDVRPGAVVFHEKFCSTCSWPPSYDPFSGFTCSSQHEEFCSRWGASKAWARCPGNWCSARQTKNMTFPRTTVWEMFS